MKPGRELDALIGSKVMGHLILRHDDAHRFIGGVDYYEAWSHDGRTLAEYSISIAAAWEVVEKLSLFKNKITKPDNPKYSSYVQLWQSDDGTWVIGNWENQLFILSEGETAPHAICLAALRIVGVLK